MDEDSPFYSSTPQRIAPAIETDYFVSRKLQKEGSTPQRIAPAIETTED